MRQVFVEDLDEVVQFVHEEPLEVRGLPGQPSDIAVDVAPLWARLGLSESTKGVEQSSQVIRHVVSPCAPARGRAALERHIDCRLRTLLCQEALRERDAELAVLLCVQAEEVSWDVAEAERGHSAQLTRE